MTKHDAITTPMIELAEMLIDKVEEYKDEDYGNVAQSWDRYDLINELDRYDLFEEE